MVQSYYNLVDQPQGYRRDYILTPEAGDPMTQPIVLLCLSTVKAVVMMPSGQMRVDQSQLIYKPAPL